MQLCKACYDARDLSYLDARRDCTVCEGHGRAPGCDTCQRIPDCALSRESVHTCDCGVMWGLDSRGTRYWVAPAPRNWTHITA